MDLVSARGKCETCARQARTAAERIEWGREGERGRGTHFLTPISDTYSFVPIEISNNGNGNGTGPAAASSKAISQFRTPESCCEFSLMMFRVLERGSCFVSPIFLAYLASLLFFLAYLGCENKPGKREKFISLSLRGAKCHHKGECCFGHLAIIPSPSWYASQ